jgi:hypothetical protein
VGLGLESKFDGHLEQSFVKVQKLVGVRAESNDVGSQFGFALFFLVGRVDAVEIGIPLFPGKVKMRPKMVEDLFEPALTGEFLGANFILAIDVILLQLNPMVTEAAAEQVGPTNVVLRGD